MLTHVLLTFYFLTKRQLSFVYRNLTSKTLTWAVNNYCIICMVDYILSTYLSLVIAINT